MTMRCCALDMETTLLAELAGVFRKEESAGDRFSLLILPTCVGQRPEWAGRIAIAFITRLKEDWCGGHDPSPLLRVQVLKAAVREVAEALPIDSIGCRSAGKQHI